MAGDNYIVLGQRDQWSKPDMSTDQPDGSWQRMKQLSSAGHHLKVLVCIQGGGAKGAWEAGVLEALLSSAKPVAFWGSSAGAINAWLAQEYLRTSSSGAMLDRWLAIGQRVRLVLAAVSLSVASILGIALWISPVTLCVLVIGLATLALVSLTRSDRIPGLVPHSVLARLLPLPDGPALHHCYFCVADITTTEYAPEWRFEQLGVFHVKPGNCKARELQEDAEVSINHAVAASAGLPFAAGAMRYGDRLFMDGGIVANLPGGHILQHGASGGHAVVCIVPKPLESLNASHPVDYRTLRFLHSLRDKQARARRIAAENSLHVLPAHAQTPVLVITPSSTLRSGLLKGFFRHSLLMDDFEAGTRAGEDLVSALEDNQIERAKCFLLGNLNLSPIEDSVPGLGWIACWVNRRWK